MPRLEQLRKFVAWEREHSPDTTHIAEWALQEIERLRAPCGGEAVAWGTPLGDTGAWSVTCHPHPGDVARGIWQPLYTAPPSAPAGVEGLQRLTADASQLVERFRDRAEYEDKHVLELAERDGLVVEKYSGSQTGALLRQAADALEAARVDANRYRWLRISADISWNGNCAHSMLFATDEDREALDTAVDAAMADTARGEEGV